MLLELELTTAELDKVLSHLTDRTKVTAAETETGWLLIYPDTIDSEVQAGLAASGSYVPVPEEVTMRQARTVLILAGLYDSVDAMLQGDTSTQGKLNLIAWEYANEVRRDSPLIAAMAGALNLTPGQVDDMFRQAATIL